MGMFEVLRVAVDALDEAGIAHMVAGSVASARHSEARATQDIDIVIDPTSEQMDALLRTLRDSELYVGDGRAALAHRSQFNVIDSSSGWKVDFIVRRDRPYSVVELERRLPVQIGGVDCWITTPEDSILSKLEWAAASGSERQLSDVRSLLVAQAGALDVAYLERWAGELGVELQLASLRGELGA